MIVVEEVWIDAVVVLFLVIAVLFDLSEYLVDEAVEGIFEYVFKVVSHDDYQLMVRVLHSSLFNELGLSLNLVELGLLTATDGLRFPHLVLG